MLNLEIRQNHSQTIDNLKKWEVFLYHGVNFVFWNWLCMDFCLELVYFFNNFGIHCKKGRSQPWICNEVPKFLRLQKDPNSLAWQLKN